MDETVKNKANSGVLYIGALETFRGYYDWLKWFYAHKGYRFCDVRKHILTRYDHMVNDFTFKELFEWYSYQMSLRYREEVCGVVNDNDAQGACCAAPYVGGKFCSELSHIYPKVKTHPMAAFRNHRITKFGYIPIEDLVLRLSRQ